jgi:hypothetical protein
MHVTVFVVITPSFIVALVVTVVLVQVRVVGSQVVFGGAVETLTRRLATALLLSAKSSL